jgi:hypothetical protein
MLISFIFSRVFIKIIILSILVVLIGGGLLNLLRDKEEVEQTGEELYEKFTHRENADDELRLGDMLKNGYETHLNPILPNPKKAIVHYQRIIRTPKIEKENPIAFNMAVERVEEILEDHREGRDDDEDLRVQMALLHDAQEVARRAPPIKPGEKKTLKEKAKEEIIKQKPQNVHDNDVQKSITKIYMDNLKEYEEFAPSNLKKYLKKKETTKEIKEIIEQIKVRDEKLHNLKNSSEIQVLGALIGFIESIKGKEQKADLYDALRQNLQDCRFTGTTALKCGTGVAGRIVSTIQVINPENEKTRISTFWETYELIKNKCGKIMLDCGEDEEKAKKEIKKLIRNEYTKKGLLSKQKGKMVLNEMMMAF